ncbi:hypothetical protein BDV96DRAFT_593791 [Lophiotrema nucula]|uniref:Uncharacterized protein n=1 Tax=Lophiotrema nucula TaxID=690887 RepID=A0A6A5ZQ60_9PLEO|nr:hypothetical protein BDV96DRAFT_593791 [Lophiotrema nucula]
MPPIRTLPTATKPLKTERTHEENQERAYIAASRRSDRSLEARIESARRASEIHKKRTGRALRVTEQDVVNEEMYEEEDDDLPTQYQRLSAHLQSGSLMFNRKLHDYIATQAAVRNQFMQQYSPFQFAGNGQQLQPNASQFQGQVMNPYMQQPQMLPPHMFHQTPQSFNGSPATFAPQQSFQQPQSPQQRQAPYAIPQRPQPHQRSASIATPQDFQHNSHLASPTTATTQGDGHRRMSLPPQALEQATFQNPENQSRPTLSRSTTGHTTHHAASPQHKLSSATNTPPSTHGTPHQSGNTTPTSHPLMTPNFATASQVINMSPLTMSLPPESQQFVGSALDPQDPRTSMYMAGSERIPQPFGIYTYNPNLSPKSSRTMGASTAGLNTSSCASSAGLNQTMSPHGLMHLDTSVDGGMSSQPGSAMSESMISPFTAMHGLGLDYPSFDTFNDNDLSHHGNNQEQQEDYFDSSNWLNDVAFES